jgi:hypothetical protein
MQPIQSQLLRSDFAEVASSFVTDSYLSPTSYQTAPPRDIWLQKMWSKIDSRLMGVHSYKLSVNFAT